MRRKKHEEHQNHERWLISYADFITLLFAFFVVMYSISAINESKFRVLSEALNAAFRAIPKSMEPVQFGHPSKPDMIQNRELNRAPSVAIPTERVISLPNKPFFSNIRQGHDGHGAGREGEGGPGGEAMREIARRIERDLAPLIARDLITVRRFRHWLEIEIKANVLFESGSAAIEQEALPVLQRIAGILREYPNSVHIEGFTDNVPIRTPAFPSNWELSAARATNVVHLFVAEGIEPARLAAVGYGEHRPVASNATEEGRRQNRKVVLVVLADPQMQRLRELEDTFVPPPPPPPPVAVGGSRGSAAIGG